MTAITIRPSRRADAQALADILNPLIEDGTSTALEGIQTAADWVDLAAGSIDRSACFVAVDTDGRVVGFQYIEPSSIDPVSVCGIASFARIDAGGRGIGRALFAKTTDAARKLGYQQIGATIRADNVSGLAYYTAIGFRDDTVFKGVPLGNGRKVDRIRKTFDLGLKDT